MRLTEVKRERALLKHLLDAHYEAFAEAVKCLPSMHAVEERVIGVYNEAIALRTRPGAPLASYSIDRKCLREAALATSGDSIQSLVCFLCGCIYPHREMELKQPINWYKPLEYKGMFFS